MSDFIAPFYQYIPNFALLIALTYAYGLLLGRIDQLSAAQRSAVGGLLFGLIAVTSMNLPIPVAEGIVVDGRNVIVMLAAPYAGTAAGVIAALTGAAYRLHLGGVGAYAGAAAIVTAAAWGIAYRHWFRTGPSTVNPSHILLLSLAMTVTTLGWIFTIPAGPLVTESLQRTALPLAVMTPLTATLLGMMLSHEFRRLELVSESKEKEERLESSQRLAKMGDFAWDIGTGKVTWSNAMYELLGYDGDETLDMAAINAHVHHPDDLDRVTEWLTSGIRSGREELGRNDYRLVHRDGSVLHVQVTGRFELVNGKAVRLVGTCLDVSDTVKATTDLMAARDEAERANRTKSEFLASMSHELRTPLNAVLGYGQMLQLDRQQNLTPTQHEYVDHILTGGHHLLELVNDILDLARIEADRLPVHPEEVQPNGIIADCVADITHIARDKSVTIVDRLSDKDFEPMWTDKLRLRQIATNLLSNAVKYNKDGGSVSVEGAATEYGYFRLSISDTGIGIPKKRHVELFQLFHRVSEDPMISAEGVGIGLAVSKMLTLRLGGHIGFESEVGKGSTFWVELPLVSNDAVLIWTDELRVGVDPIDRDHQIIFSLTNKASRRDLSYEDMAEVVEEMIAYTQHHFRREEAIMQVCGYPELEAHRARHRKLENHVNRMAEAWRAKDDPEALVHLCGFLRDWWRHHILQVDTSITPYTKGKDEDIRTALA